MCRFRLIAVCQLVLTLTLLDSARGQSSVEMPWKTEQLYQTPEFRWLKEAETSPVLSLMYSGEHYLGQPTEVFAFYASPSTLRSNKANNESANPTDLAESTADQKFPGVVLIHGGGGTAFREWAELWAKRGYAAIAMDLAGYQPIPGQNAHVPKHRQRIERPGPDQSDEEKFGSVDKPATEQWPYHAVANVIRAHSLLRSFAEVDAERTAVTGISWGGYLTCIAAGVDQRFKAAVPVYGCGFLQKNSAWLNRFEQMTPSQRERWGKLWDPAQYLPEVKQPILFVNGTNDFAYPLDSYMSSYDLVPGEKQLCVTVNLPHSHPEGWKPAEIGIFIDHHLRDQLPLLRVGDPTVVQEKVLVSVSGTNDQNSIKSAALHFTTGNEPINQRGWETQTANLSTSGGSTTVTADAPPANATAWFLTVQDSRNATVSTRVILPQN
jgi:dienelactone hydrolase